MNKDCCIKMHSNGQQLYSKRISNVDKTIAHKILNIGLKTISILYLSVFITFMYFKINSRKIILYKYWKT